MLWTSEFELCQSLETAARLETGVCSGSYHNIIIKGRVEAVSLSFCSQVNASPNMSVPQEQHSWRTIRLSEGYKELHLLCDSSSNSCLCSIIILHRLGSLCWPCGFWYHWWEITIYKHKLSKTDSCYNFLTHRINSCLNVNIYIFT